MSDGFSRSISVQHYCMYCRRFISMFQHLKYIKQTTLSNIPCSKILLSVLVFFIKITLAVLTHVDATIYICMSMLHLLYHQHAMYVCICLRKPECTTCSHSVHFAIIIPTYKMMQLNVDYKHNSPNSEFSDIVNGWRLCGCTSTSSECGVDYLHFCYFTRHEFVCRCFMNAPRSY